MPSVDLRCGDCLELMKGIPDGSIDAVITDPPYGIDYQSAWRTDKKQWKPKIANDAKPFIWWLYDAYRVTKDGGALFCFCRWDVQEAFKLAIEWAGFDVKSQVIWDRRSHGMGDLNGSFAPQHDVIWFATKGRCELRGSRPSSILQAMRLSGEQLVHPNEKPVSLMIQLIEAVTDKGDTVVDCFTGSGATGVACVKTGRNFIGFELDPNYFAIADKRIHDALAQQTLDLSA